MERPVRRAPTVGASAPASSAICRRRSSSRRCSASATSTAARTAAVETWGSTARAATRARADTEILIMTFSGLRIFVQVGAMAPSAIAPGAGRR